MSQVLEDVVCIVAVTSDHTMRSRSRSRSRSPEKHYKLPEDVSQISESDYFLKSAEFRVWLKDEKRKVC